ncbi:MAG TPA: GTPase ObgE [Candidatus Wallbacteria bacterium]|nr:GTPase ObgE [Candidatus Wallbacteria bacterium]
MFIDEAVIFVKGGDGGNGCVSFRREKFVPKGGPDGGDGGDGASIIFKASHDLHTLLDFKNKHMFVGGDGEHGMGSKRYGKDADDIIVKVPVGTQFYDEKTNELIADLDADGKECVVARGGGGGRGNTKFTTSTRHAPRYSELGEIGEERNIKLVLKLIADIGLVGYPNAGKSTILSKVSKATPKIADYPFTTLSPNLGVAKLSFNKTLVIADIPGIIEGAHKGVGLGNKFLKHIERTRGIVYVIDMTGFETRDPGDDLKVLYRELKSFSKVLVNKPFIIAANKMDIPDSAENFEKFQKKIKRLKTFKDIKIIQMSGLAGKNLDKLLVEMYKLKMKSDAEAEEEERKQKLLERSDELIVVDSQNEGAADDIGLPYEKVVNNRRKRQKASVIKVKKMGKSEYQIICPEFELVVSRINFKADDSAYFFRGILKKYFVDKALRKAGVVNGDTIYVQDFVFEYQDEL